MRKFDNRYILQQKIGEGTMGVVFLAKDQLHDNKLVALKTIKADFISNNKEAVTFFKNEFIILSSLKHPNLVSVDDFGIDEKQNSYYLVMEYLVGKSLKNYLKECSVLDLNTTLDILVQILRALEYIHSRDIVLRDLKPDNVFLTVDADDRILVKLLDFGLADLHKRHHKEVKGTASYLAPEVFSGQTTARSDIFAAGVILFEMLTKQTFYKDNALKSVISALTSQQFFEENNNIDLLGNSACKTAVAILTSFKAQERPASASLAIEFINSVFKTKFLPETVETADAYLQYMRFVDKHQEFAFLQDYLHARVVKRDNLILITGKGGTGKTRLLYEMQNYCLVHNIFFLSGDGESYQHGYTHIFRELVYYASEQLLEKFHFVLSQILPDHPLLLSGLNLDKRENDEKKQILISNLVDFLLEFQKEKKKKVVLWFSRFEEANELTCDLLKELIVRRSNGSAANKGLIVIADIKDNLISLRAPIENFISFMEKNNLLAKMELQPFEITEGVIYFQQMFGVGKISRQLEIQLMNILNESEGNPFFIQQMLKAFIENGSIVKQKGLWQPQGAMELPDLPDKLSYLLTGRLKKIMRRKADLDVLNVISVVNRPLSVLEIQALVSSNTRERLSSALDYLQKNDFVKEEDGAFIGANQLIVQAVRNMLDGKKMALLKFKLAEKFCTFFGITPKNIEMADRLQVSEIADLYYDVDHYPSRKVKKILRFLEVASNKFVQVYAGTEALKYIRKSCDMLEILSKKQNSDQTRLLANYHKQVRILFLLGNFKEAKNILEKALVVAQEAGSWQHLNSVYNLFGDLNNLQSDYEKSFYYYNLQIELLNQVNPPDKRRLALAYNCLGRYYIQTNQILKAKECFEVKYKHYFHTREFLEHSSVLGNLALVEIKLGNYDQGVLLLKRKIRLDRKINNISGLASAYGSMAIIYLEKKEHRHTMRYTKMQYRLSKEIGNKIGMTAALANMSSSCISKNEFHKALHILMEKSKIDNEIGNKKGLSITLGNLGIVYKHLGKYAKSLDFFQKKYNLSISMNNRLGAAIALSNQAEIQVELNNYQQAHLDYDRAIDMAAELKANFYLAIFWYCKASLSFIEKNYDQCREYSDFAKSTGLISNNYDILSNLQILESYLDYLVASNMRSKKLYLDMILKIIAQKTDGLDKTEQKYQLLQFLSTEQDCPADFDLGSLAKDLKSEFENYHAKKYIVEKLQQKIELITCFLK